MIYGHIGNNIVILFWIIWPDRCGGTDYHAQQRAPLSDHPWRGAFHGMAHSYLLGLSAHGALRQTRAILLGYLGNPTQVEVRVRWVSRFHDERSSRQVIIDPVIRGHDHGVYVDSGMIETYLRHLLPPMSRTSCSG